MALYETMDEVLWTIRQRYEGVTRLNVSLSGALHRPYFAPHLRHGNAVGCTIGCLIPDVALLKRWDARGGSVDQILRTRPAEVRRYFGAAIPTAFLRDVQSAHDRVPWCLAPPLGVQEMLHHLATIQAHLADYIPGLAPGMAE